MMGRVGPTRIGLEVEALLRALGYLYSSGKHLLYSAKAFNV